ncbi:MAG: P-II family nitrogen regulator [Burkholderiales bacterium]|nr:P-II family nitrogen regulator [Burkholderiales bacterium]
MKEIKAIIRPSHLHKVRDAFRALPGFPGMTVSQAEGSSAHSGVERHDTIRGELTDFTRKVRIEILAPDEMVLDIVSIVHENAHTGQMGDGVLWVSEVQDFVHLCLPFAGR